MTSACPRAWVRTRRRRWRAFADEIDRVAGQLVVFHFEQQQRVRFAGHVEAFRGFERMAQFEWPLGGRNDDEIGHIAGHIHTLPAGGSR